METKAKEIIRIFLQDENGKAIMYDRQDTEHETTIDKAGYEELLLREDSAKINLYQNSDFIYLANEKTYKVIGKSFMPCRPVTLYIKLKEVLK